MSRLLDRMKQAIAFNLVSVAEWRAPHGEIGHFQAKEPGMRFPRNYVGFLTDDEDVSHGDLCYFSSDIQSVTSAREAALFAKLCGAVKAQGEQSR